MVLMIKPVIHVVIIIIIINVLIKVTLNEIYRLLT